MLEALPPPALSPQPPPPTVAVGASPARAVLSCVAREGEGLGVPASTVALVVEKGLRLPERVPEVEGVEEGVKLPLAERRPVTVTVGVPVALCVALGEKESEALVEGVGKSVPSRLRVVLAVTVALAVALGVLVALGDTLEEALGEALLERVAEPVALTVTVALPRVERVMVMVADAVVLTEC